MYFKENTVYHLEYMLDGTGIVQPWYMKAIYKGANKYFLCFDVVEYYAFNKETDQFHKTELGTYEPSAGFHKNNGITIKEIGDKSQVPEYFL